MSDDLSEIMWTEDSEAHIARHGVEPHEVTEATERPLLRCHGARYDPRRTPHLREEREMTSKKKIDELREYYDTHDTAAEMEAAVEAGTLTRHEGVPDAMASYSIRLPAAVLDDARDIAKARGTTVGAWLREAVESAVTQAQGDDVAVPISVLLAAAAEYRHRKAS